jgi:radical SAM enzyme (TIGR01210 family)
MSPFTGPSSSPVTSSNVSSSRYPESPAERTGWILARRGARNRLDPGRAYAALAEEERTEAGEVVPVATVFLTNRECPWRCLMCDLWVNTLETEVFAGAIPGQIRAALAGLPPARRLKLYNAGSFFDPKAIPPSDHAAIAALAAPFERVVVESHPALVGEACFRFHELLGGRLEVALGLETAHPEVLARLNKGMTPDDFRRAAGLLGARRIPVRAFVLVGLPFLSPDESRQWCRRSAAFAFDCGAAAVSLIPTRTGNGALDALVKTGDFAPPTLGLLEACLADGIHLGRGRVFADLWDLDRLADCATCFSARASRLSAMNLEQRLPPPVSCDACGGTAP